MPQRGSAMHYPRMFASGFWGYDMRKTAGPTRGPTDKRTACMRQRFAFTQAILAGKRCSFGPGTVIDVAEFSGFPLKITQ